MVASQDSNPQPVNDKSVALPVAPPRHEIIVSKDQSKMLCVDSIVERCRVHVVVVDRSLFTAVPVSDGPAFSSPLTLL